jgi:hypothetical protein
MRSGGTAAGQFPIRYADITLSRGGLLLLHLRRLIVALIQDNQSRHLKLSGLTPSWVDRPDSCDFDAPVQGLFGNLKQVSLEFALNLLNLADIAKDEGKVV